MGIKLGRHCPCWCTVTDSWQAVSRLIADLKIKDDYLFSYQQIQIQISVK